MIPTPTLDAGTAGRSLGPRPTLAHAATAGATADATTRIPRPLQAPAAASPGRRVVDAPTRMFHGLFALSFAGAYLTAESEHWRLLHVTLGYGFAGLLVFRIVYGLAGPRQASLGALWRKLTGLPAWLRGVLAAARHEAGVDAGGRVPGPRPPIAWRQGQNLAMALAIVLMLALVLPLVLSGYASYNDAGDLFEELHETLGNTFLLVVLAHLGLLLVLSLLRRQNQALPMLTGRQPGSGPDLVRHDRRGLAALLLVALLAFGAWQWWDAPLGGTVADAPLAVQRPGPPGARHQAPPPQGADPRPQAGSIARQRPV